MKEEVKTTIDEMGVAYVLSIATLIDRPPYPGIIGAMIKLKEEADKQDNDEASKFINQVLNEHFNVYNLSAGKFRGDQ